MTSPELRTALGRVLRQPAFVAATVLLLLAAVGLNASVQFLKLHFKKEPVPLARPLTMISGHLGTWVQVTPDEAIDKEIQDVLGTDQYVFREYVDTRIVPDAAASFKILVTPEQRRQKIGLIQARESKAVIRLAVTYYTGMVDTVAHVPDRCVVAEGYEPTSYETVKWPIGIGLPEEAKRGSDDVELRYINFEDLSGFSRAKRSIAYFFHVNGHFESSPLGVRARLQKLTERRAYYAKVEVMTLIDDPVASKKVMTDFLSSALPEIYQSMPDWDKVTREQRN